MPCHYLPIGEGTIFYKRVHKRDGKLISDYSSDFVYPRKIGSIIRVEDFDPDRRVLCSRGIHGASWEYCQHNWTHCPIILKLKITKSAKICVPYGTDGKFRVSEAELLEIIEDDKDKAEGKAEKEEKK